MADTEPVISDNSTADGNSGDRHSHALHHLVESITDPEGDSDVYASLRALGASSELAQELHARIERSKRESARLRRREFELGALVSSARELAAERDSDVLLERIVDRAHSLVGSDLTYLSEYDPDTRELFVRKTIGSVSSDFRALRVPPGKGLASVVVERRAPAFVEQYSDYEQSRHESGIDNAVAAEGIVSMLGVPMLAEDEVLGVLFVSTRDRHVFTHEDSALLTALADHASVVLQTARTLRNLERAEDESRRALARLTEHLIQRDRSHSVHKTLVQAMLSGGDSTTVADTLARELARPVTIVDRAGRALATGGGTLLTIGAELCESIRDSAESGRYVEIRDDGPVDGLAAFAAGERHLGTIVLGAGDFPISDVDARTVERAAQVCALLSLSQEAVAEAAYRVHSELIADLLAADSDQRAAALARARQRGIDASGFTSLLALAVPTGLRSEAVRAAAAAAPAATLAGEHHGLVVIVGPDELTHRADDIRRHVAQRIDGAVLGVRPPLGATSDEFAIARKTVRLLDALGVTDAVVNTSDYAHYAAIFDADSAVMRHFIDEAIGAVKSYDLDRGTELLPTLRAFVHNGGSPTRTARALNYHVNTVLQRLERLDRVLSKGWREDENLFRLSLAVRMDEMRDRLVSEPRSS